MRWRVQQETCVCMCLRVFVCVSERDTRTPRHSHTPRHFQVRRGPRQKMLLWKFYRMAWIAHAKADAPAASWVVHPARITSLHLRLTEVSPALGKQKDVTVDSITATVDDRIVAKWKRSRVCPWSAGDQFSDPFCQNWTEREQPVTQFREHVCHQSRMWHIYSTELNVCGERMVN